MAIRMVVSKDGFLTFKSTGLIPKYRIIRYNYRSKTKKYCILDAD